MNVWIEFVLRWVCILLSCTFFGTGVSTLYYTIKFMRDESYEQEQGAAIAWMGVIQGTLSLLVPFIGVCAAVGRERFAVCCTVIFIYNIAYTAYGAKKHAEIGENKDRFMTKSFDDFVSDVMFRGRLFEFQKNNECCGIYDKGDYVKANRDLPPSCCKDEENPCKNPFDQGCGDKLFTEFLQSYSPGGVTKVLLFLMQISCALLGFVLANFFYTPNRLAEARAAREQARIDHENRERVAHQYVKKF